MVTRMLSFPDTKISKDPEEANYQNYLAWQAQTVQRRRQSQTQFNLYQCRTAERTVDQALYKEEAARDSNNLKQLVERRLSQACDCDTCDATPVKERSNSDAGSSSERSSSSSSRSSMSSLITATAAASISPPGTMVRGPTSPSSKNSLITSPPPRSRHHHRRRARSLPA